MNTSFKSIAPIIMVALFSVWMSAVATPAAAQPAAATPETRTLTITATGRYDGVLEAVPIGGKSVVCKAATLSVLGIAGNSTYKATSLETLPVDNVDKDKRLCKATFNNVKVFSKSATNVTISIKAKLNNDAIEAPIVSAFSGATVPGNLWRWWHDLGTFTMQ